MGQSYNILCDSATAVPGRVRIPLLAKAAHDVLVCDVCRIKTLYCDVSIYRDVLLIVAHSVNSHNKLQRNAPEKRLIFVYNN